MKNLIISCVIAILIILMFYFMISPDKGIIRRKVIETREYTETNDGETTIGTGEYYKVYYFELNDGGWSGYIDSIEFTKYKVNEFYPKVKK